MISEKGHIGWLLSGIIMLLLVACSSSDDRIEPQVQEPQAPEQPDGNFSLVSFIRANSAMTVTDNYSPIGVFLVDEDVNVETQSGRFIYKTNDELWKSSIEVTNDHNYAIYGYAPADAVSAAISSESLDGATLTFSNLPTVSTHDICFVVGVQQLETTSTPKNIPLGSFSFIGQSSDNFANLLMDHIYAGLKLQMTIDADYAQLRSIKIRKLELKTTTSTAATTVTLVANNTGTSPVSSVTYGTATGTERTATFFDSTEGVELDATAMTEATCCFVPTLGEDLTLVTTYDVYNKNGNKISERTATNKLPNLNAARGRRITLNMTIAPTYLYVLSDPDLDNPTVVVN